MSQDDVDDAKTPLPRNVRLLGFASLLNDVASEMIAPLMPLFLLTVVGGTRIHLGIIEGLADTVSSMVKLWAGARSDRAGERKTFVVVGYALAALARPVIALAGSPWHVCAIRFVDRIGKGIRTAPRDALIAESTPRRHRGRAFGFHRGMDHLGAAIGPLLATAFLLVWPGQLRVLFLATLIPGLVLVILVAKGLREPQGPGAVEVPPMPTAEPPYQGFRTFLAAIVIFTLGNSSDAFLLVRAGELGIPPALLPLLWCLFHFVKSGGNVLAGRAVDRIGPRSLILTGWGVYAATYVGFALATEPWQAWTLFLIYGLFPALTEPSEKTFVTLLVSGERKGAAFGWYNFATGIAALPASVIFGWLYEVHGPRVAFGWGAGLALVAAAVLMGVAEKRDERGEMRADTLPGDD